MAKKQQSIDAADLRAKDELDIEDGLIHMTVESVQTFPVTEHDDASIRILGTGYVGGIRKEMSCTFYQADHVVVYR